MVSSRISLTNDEIIDYIDLLFGDTQYLLPENLLPGDRQLIYDTVNNFRDSDDRDAQLYTDDDITNVLTRILVRQGGKSNKKKNKKRKSKKIIKRKTQFN